MYGNTLIYIISYLRLFSLGDYKRTTEITYWLDGGLEQPIAKWESPWDSAGNTGVRPQRMAGKGISGCWDSAGS